MTIKVGFIKKRFNPYGGGEKYLATLIESLKGHDYEIHVFSSCWPAIKGITVHKVNCIKFNSALSVLSFNYNVTKTLKRIPLDYVLSFERVTCGDIYRAGDGCHKEWLKIRCSVEGKLKRFSFTINPLHRTILGIEKCIYKKTGIIVANSEMVKKQIQEHYNVPEFRLRVIYNGVDIKRFSPENQSKWRSKIREKYSILKKTPLVIFVGSDYERKGLRTLINSLVDTNESTKLMVIGRGNIKKFKAIAKSHKLANDIFFIGPQTEIEKFYSASDLFVLPTLYDPFSNATLEAMASGLPVITTNTNGAAELIEDGNEGYVVSNMVSSSELSEKINIVLKNRSFMGRKARNKAELFPLEYAISEFKRLINHSLS